MIDTQTDWIDLYRLLEHTNNSETNSQQDGPHHLRDIPH